MRGDHMRGIWVLWMVAVGCAACGSGSGGGSSDDTPAYVDQMLQGTIGGHAWTAATGRIDKPSEGSTSARWSAQVVSKAIDKVCDGLNLARDDKLSILFSTAAAPAVGKVDLSLGENGQTVTLVDGTPEIPMNSIAIKGFLEITAVSAGSVEAKMVADADDQNVAIGKVTLVKCCPKAGDSFTHEICTE